MSSRYDKTKIISNEYPEYFELFQRRGLKSIIHYSTNTIKNLTENDMSKLNIITDVWKVGDTMWRYASKHYNGRAELWWVIAHFNGKPTDHHFLLDDIIYIPTPVDDVLRMYGV